MDSVYANSCVKFSTVENRSQIKGFSTEKQEREVAPHKWTKVLLTLLGFSLVLALGGLCTFWILYNHKVADFESLNEQHIMVSKLLEAQEINSTGADLVTITSKSEQDFLVSKVSASHWIGLNDLDTEGRWVWVNNKTLNETGVQFWFSGDPKQPNNYRNIDPSGEDCGTLRYVKNNFGSWFDTSCKELKNFICEKEY